MLQLLSMVIPFLNRVKYLAVLVVIFFIAYFVTWRWRQTFSPPWLYIGIVMGVASFIILIIIFIRWRHGKSMAAGLEAGITVSDEDKVDLKGEIKALRDNWNESLARLKESAGSKSATATLTTLPWYIIIGEPASGKSTLLRKSGLDFPVGDAAISGMHGTRNCDWWFANEAIFLDTAGRYIIETQEAEWVTFLSLLKKYRKKRPINGVLVAVAANSLLTKTHEELLDDAKRIRARLDELIDELGINFPTYILVTKCDLISGFVEFFGPLDGRDRDQMIGWTNPPDPSAKFDAAEFDTRFNEVAAGLFQMRPWVESQGSKRGLMRAFLFPEEFTYLQQPLRTVLDSAFKPNIYQETPVCRGIYFSSGTQVGSPLAMALEDMAKDLNVAGLEELGLGRMEEEKEVRTYFIKDFVSEQVLKDRDMNWRTKAAEQRVKKRRMGWGMVGVAAAALLMLFGTSSFLANRGRLSAFEKELPKAGRPLEVAVGCMKAHDEAVPPSVLDIGLNYSDDLMPSFRKTFHELFTRGILDPLLSSIEASTARTLPEQSPDVDGYARTYSHYLYLRDGLAGNLPEEFDKSTEREHLDALFALLEKKNAVGEATPEDLRAAIRRFGETAKPEGIPEHRRRAVEKKFSDTVGRFVAKVTSWADAAQARGDSLAGSHEDAVNGLINAAKAQRTHETKEAIDTLANAIIGAAKRSDGPKEQPVSSLAKDIQETEDLKSILRTLAQALEPEDASAKKIDALTRRLSVSATTPKMEAENLARRALLDFLAKEVVGRKSERVAYDPKPNRKWLETRRGEILAKLEDLREETLEAIRPHVEELGGETQIADKDGKLQPNPGWWDTIVYLVQAKEADVQFGDYLTSGLIPWLTHGSWRTLKKSDEPYEIYTVERLESQILVRLRKQTKFFEQGELLATEIRIQAHEEATNALTEYFIGKKGDTGEREGGMLGYWLGRFDGSLPAGQPRNIDDASKRIQSWNNSRSSLVITSKALKKALWDITRLTGPEEDDEDDPVLRETQNARKQVFDTFVIFFDAPDDRVSPHMSVWDAMQVMKNLEDALREGAAGFGAINQRGARQLVGKVMLGQQGAFAETMRLVEQFKQSSSTSRAAELVAERTKELVTATWTGLVELAVKDVNERWRKGRDSWILDLEEDGTPASFQRIFGRDGQSLFSKFRTEMLEPFFEFSVTGVERRPSPGKYLELDTRFVSFLRNVDTIGSDVFEKSGGFRTERIDCEMALAGDASPTSLKIEYVSKSKGTVASGEFRNSEAHKDFAFEWSPEDCMSLKFIVGFSEGRKREIFFEGDWAVAEALTEADRVESTWTWKRTDEELGAYEVRLKLRGPAPSFAGVFRKFGGENPVKAVITRLRGLESIVTVEPR